MRRLGCTLLLFAGLVCALPACSSRPRQRPLPTTPIDQGPETMSAVRKQLEGRWVLVSVNVTAPDGRSSPIDATGVLTADAFGGLNIEYRMSEGGQKTLTSFGISSPNPVISTSGRVVIDTQQKQITYAGDDFEKRALGFDPDLAARRANPFALERVRYYSFDADGTLTLTTRHDNGREASVSRWKKSG